MRAGLLRDRVVLQSPSTAASTQSGAGVVTYGTLATVWANVRARSGGESLTAGAVTSQAAYDVEIRQRSDVTPGMRVQWTPYGGSAITLGIAAVLPAPAGDDRMVLQCGVVQ